MQQPCQALGPPGSEVWWGVTQRGLEVHFLGLAVFLLVAGGERMGP